MPLLLSKKIDDHEAAYAVWKISETNGQLQRMITERPPKDYHPTKQAEWMATRMLIENLCQKFDLDYQGIVKDQYGKPFLKGHTAQISISHSFPIASAMIHMNSPCGIDVEWPRATMQRVQHKFLNAEEYQYRDDQKALCIIWAAKEAIYKRYGKKQLSFKDNMKVEITENGLRSWILQNDDRTEIPIIHEQVKQYLLVYTF